MRDEAERLRRLLVRHRLVGSLREAGRMVLHVEGEGAVHLDGGLLVETGTPFDAPDGGGSPGTSDAPAAGVPGAAGDGHENERITVALWLRANAVRVRVLEVEGEVGLALPADRIPTLGELCARVPDVPDGPDSPEGPAAVGEAAG